jgi:hypothetical protein
MKPKLSKQAPNAAESELAAMRDIQRRSFVTAAYSVTNIICGVVETETVSLKQVSPSYREQG